MTESLPKKLQKATIVDSLFEVRFVSDSSALLVIPGFLFERLEGEKVIKELPGGQMPKALRDVNPNMQYMPITRIEWGIFYINISDASVMVSCKNPYPGWSEFKPAIIKVMNLLSQLSTLKSVLRYSLKYVDLVPAPDLEQQVSKANIDVVIAGHKLQKEHIQIRIEIPKDGFINVVQLIASAKAKIDGIETNGLAVDIDTIVTKQDPITIGELLTEFDAKLDKIHHINKSMFFNCITAETIESLEPVYECYTK